MTRYEEKIARLERQIARAKEQKAKAEKKEMQQRVSDNSKLRKALENFISDDEIKKLSEEEIIEILRQRLGEENIVSNQAPVQNPAPVQAATAPQSVQTFTESTHNMSLNN